MSLGSAYIYSQYEWIVEEVDTGFSANAKQKPYLAALKMLNNSGIEVNYLLGFSLLNNAETDNSKLSTNDSIILINAYKMLNPSRANKILAWVEKGGHLIFSTDSRSRNSDSQQGDHLLNAMGVELDQEFNRKISKFNYNPGIDCSNNYKYMVTTKLDGVDQPVLVGFMSSGGLVDKRNDANVYLLDENRIKMLQKNYGKGLITVMTTMAMWTNEQIGCNDQAFLLWYLVNQGGQVWMLQNLSAPSLFELAWAQQPLTIVMLFSLLLLWIWRKSARFGPIKLVNSEGRRQIQEHLRAAGKFFWRHTETEVVVEELVEGIKLKVKNRYSLSNIGDSEIAEIVCNITGIKRNLVDDVLEAKKHVSDSELITQVRLLKLIRETL
ncbi:DUF4350 domain-containing protein [Pseudomonadota bacterium]